MQYEAVAVFTDDAKLLTPHINVREQKLNQETQLSVMDGVGL